MRPHAVGSWVLLTATLLSGCSDSTGVGYENGIIASLKSDLVGILAAQDAFYLANSDYAGSIGATDGPGTGGAGRMIFRPSYGNVIVLTYRDAGSWTATEWSIQAPGTTTVCGIYQGPPSASPNAAVTSPRTAACW